MSNSLRNSLLVAIVFALSAGVYMRLDSAEEAKKDVPQKREYHSVSDPGPRHLESIGNEGWNLVSVTDDGSSVRYYFQRVK